MGFFSTLTGRSSGSGEQAVDLESVRPGLPARFEVIGELLAEGQPTSEACSVVGAELARSGVDLGEALQLLRRTYRLLVDTDPPFEDVERMSVSWGEETLGYMHQISCVDPLTGLATLAHLRANVAELYQQRTGADVPKSHALVVVELTDHLPQLEGSLPAGMRMAQGAENLRMVFAGSGAAAQVGPRRLVTLVKRTETLPQRVSLVRDLFADMDRRRETRVWVESLPPTNQGAAWLLDELTRI